MATEEQTEKQQKVENRNGRKNNCMDISSYKPARLDTRSGYGKEKETSRDKLNLF